jgi:adenosylcobinamide-phosphate synthase
MVNTLDSMVGYKNWRYRRFGWAAARIDDLANFIPARLSILIIFLASRVLNAGRGRSALHTAINEGANHSSPNAGYPEAAFAGALHVKLNGPNMYGGVLVDKPYIGVDFGSVRIVHIRRACELMILAAVIAGLMAWSAASTF